MPVVFRDPPISLFTAHCLAVFFAGSYVGSLYLSKNARLSFRKGLVQLRPGEQRAKEQSEWIRKSEKARAGIFPKLSNLAER